MSLGNVHEDPRFPWFTLVTALLSFLSSLTSLSIMPPPPPWTKTSQTKSKINPFSLRGFSVRNLVMVMRIAK
jgi:hypothetical protein